MINRLSPFVSAPEFQSGWLRFVMADNSDCVVLKAPEVGNGEDDGDCDDLQRTSSSPVSPWCNCSPGVRPLCHCSPVQPWKKNLEEHLQSKTIVLVDPS